MLPPWKGSVLTAWPRCHFMGVRLGFEPRFCSDLELILGIGQLFYRWSSAPYSIYLGSFFGIEPNRLYFSDTYFNHFYLLCEPNGVVLLIIFVNMCPFILYELSNGLLNFLLPYLIKLNGDSLALIRWYNLHFSANVFRVVPKMRKVTLPWWTRRDLNARPVTLGRKIGFEPILFLFETVFLIRLTQKVTALPTELRVHFLLFNQSSFATSLYLPSFHLSSVYFTLGTIFDYFFMLFCDKELPNSEIPCAIISSINLLSVPNLSKYYLWSEWRDLNSWPLRPRRSALPNWATSRCMGFFKPLIYCYYIILFIHCQEDKY